MAVISHDGLKHGKENKQSEFTIAEHPVVCAEWLKEQTDLMSMLTPEQAQMLYDAVASHMGEWNTDYKTKKVILPKPITPVQQFVHLCDYLASRKWIDIDFEEDYYDGNFTPDEDYEAIILDIIQICKDKIAAGIDRDTLYKTIFDVSGVMNPRKITDHGVAVATLNKLKEEVT